MQRTPVTPQACDTAPDAMDVDSGVTDLRDLLDVTPVDNAAEATDLINTDTDVRGFLTVDGDGLLHMTISRATVSSVNDTMSTPGLPVSLSILDGAIGMFNRQALTVAQIMASDPAVFANEAFTAAVQEAPGFTRQDQPRDRLERERYDEHPGIAGLVEHPRWRNRHVQPAGAHRGANHGIRPGCVRQ